MVLYFAYDRRISKDLLEEELHAEPGSIERVSTPSTQGLLPCASIATNPFCFYITVWRLNVVQVGPAHLPGWRFVCNRGVSKASGVVLQCNAVASQEGHEGTGVEGMVFRLTDTQLHALDQVQQEGYVKSIRTLTIHETWEMCLMASSIGPCVYVTIYVVLASSSYHVAAW